MKTETALEWFQRCQKRQTAALIPTDPSSGARVFVAGNSGLAPIDMAWKLPLHIGNSIGSNAAPDDSPPVLVVEGAIAKTWMLLSLAARFVVTTRPSHFGVDENLRPPDNVAQDDSPSKSTTTSLPRVVILDSSLDLTLPKLANVIRSTLLRQVTTNMSTVEQELDDCLDRIHIARVDDDGLRWLPVLEALRFKLKHEGNNNNMSASTTTSSSSSSHPTLILWDGYSEHHNQRPEITRQVSRLLKDCNVALVLSTDTTNHSYYHHHHDSHHHYNYKLKFDWMQPTRRAVHRIHLEQRSGKDCFAVVNGCKRPFSISSGGILS